MAESSKTSAEISPHEFELSGGALCLDFANTVADRPQHRQEHLSSYQDLLEWASQAGIIDDEQSARLLRLADHRKTDATEVFSRAIELRECLYRIFSRIATGDRPHRTDVEELNGWVASAMAHLRLADRDDGLDWTWSGYDAELDSVLWPVVRSAAELLVSNDAARVGECDGAPCSWLFIDRSRTGRRRWCDMKTCGNRDKARRYYRRHKGKH